jgi:hypothetical protein
MTHSVLSCSCKPDTISTSTNTTPKDVETVSSLFTKGGARNGTRRNRTMILVMVALVLLTILGISSILDYNVAVVGQSSSSSTPEGVLSPTSTTQLNYRKDCPLRTVMYMEGFQFTSYSFFFSPTSSSGQQQQPCLNLLFSKWTLNNPIKLVVAALVVFTLGILTELLSTGIRSYYYFSTTDTSSYHHRNLLLQPSLHILQATLSYIDMLVVMTFSIELFIMLLAGLGIGRYISIVLSKYTNMIHWYNKQTIQFTPEEIMITTAENNSIPCCDFIPSYHHPDDERNIIMKPKDSDSDNEEDSPL